jgi:predicted CopG family antitoxin
MNTKQVRISERLYARIESEKRDNETIGEALERMVGGYGLLDFAEDAEGSESLDIEVIETEMDEASRRNVAEIRESLPVEWIFRTMFRERPTGNGLEHAPRVGSNGFPR